MSHPEGLPGTGSLWRHPGFLRLWAGQTASLTGSAVSYIALPLVGIVILRLGPFGVGALATAGTLPAAVLSPFLGTIVDRVPRRRLCVICDIVRAALLGAVPVAAVAGVLGYWQLITVNALLGVATALFGVAHQALLPEVVPAASLGSGNGKLQASQSAAEVTGPGLAAWLMRDRHAAGPRRLLRGFLAETRAGFAVLWRDAVLRPLSVSGAVLVLCAQLQESVYMLFLVRGAHFSVTAIGVVFTIAGVIGFGAAAASDRIAARLGTGGLVVAGQLIIVLGGILLACVGGPAVLAAAVMLAGETCYGVGLSLYGAGRRACWAGRRPPRSACAGPCWPAPPAWRWRWP